MKTIDLKKEFSDDFLIRLFIKDKVGNHFVGGEVRLKIESLITRDRVERDEEVRKTIKWLYNFSGNPDVDSPASYMKGIGAVEKALDTLFSNRDKK